LRGKSPLKSGVGGGEGHAGPVRFKRTAHTQTRAARTTTKYDPKWTVFLVNIFRE
jgi:hypothetical protein